ncbi:MAG: twin-arginine translocase TatA/TatE family subunit [Bacteroidales bacterium]|nr:twin-arginine translocase TatA/TatE family subunit [Bacteroidales bacterium]
MSIPGFSILLFGISGGEIFIIVLLILIFFGPKRIPEIARTLGKGINEIKKVQRDINAEINRYSDEIENPVKQVKEDIEGFSKGLNKAADIHGNADNAPEGNEDSADTVAENNEDDLPYPYNQINDEPDVTVEKEQDNDDKVK